MEVNPMKRLIIALLVAAVAVAGTMTVASAAGPEVIKLEAKMGTVTFPHKAHQEKFRCKKCHEGAPGKIEGFGKDWAHKNCKGCHKDEGGPTSCKDCHKK